MNAVYVKKALKAGDSTGKSKAIPTSVNDENQFHEKTRQNASRDMHARFSQLGLSLSVGIQRVVHDLKAEKVTTHWVRPSDWIKTLMKKAPHCLIGECKDVSLQLEAFWAAYKQSHPRHAVFEHHSNKLGKVLPLALFGDEGRGPKRDKFLVWTMESLIGLDDMQASPCNCAQQVSDMEAAGLDLCLPDCVQPFPPHLLSRAASQTTNYKGHSYVTRHLLFGFPGWAYKDDMVMEKHLELLAADMSKLFWTGVEVHNGETFFAALCAIKGDMKHMVQLGIERSYHKLRGGMMCSLCEAGYVDSELKPFEDTKDEPDWAITMGSSRPWDTEPKLCAIPYDSSFPEKAFALDVFHLFKVGMARDLVASMVLVLCNLTFFDACTCPNNCCNEVVCMLFFLYTFFLAVCLICSKDVPGGTKNLPDRLASAHGLFSLWCSANRVSPGLRSFGKSFFNVTSKASYAWSSTKGSDSMLVLRFLSFYVGLRNAGNDPLGQLHSDLLKTFKRTVDAALDAFEIMNKHGLWLHRQCAQLLFLKLKILLRGYKLLARKVHDMDMTGFGLKPKFHGMGHVAFKIRSDLLAGACLIQNPLSEACEQNEDSVGRVSRLSRQLSSRGLTCRILQRYFYKKRALLTRRQPGSSKQKKRQ